MTYVTIDQQCWFARCRRKAECNVEIKGKKVKVCRQHFNSLGKPSKEQRG